MAAMIKCKMCGGDLVLTEGSTIATCEYCGTTQTVPSQDNEKKLTLFSRADRLRRNCEFDKASGVYETVVAEFPEEAEAYWGLVLCKYGIEYVDDPATGKKIPTCHRSSFDSILDDGNYEQALENADAASRKVYREEARTIEEIRKGIIAVSSKEEPYDIFICYKETAEDGQRTIDSVLAQDLYDALTEKGYRTFFARITLEDKLGQEYEPYIFAALNSAKVMLAVGTDYEYFNAVWVKNEWSRFLKLMTTDKSKHLVPCYKGIDAYDMPKEFVRLQAQDLGKIGAIQDILRGVEKLIPKIDPVTMIREREVPDRSDNHKIAALLDRGYMALEDREWSRADGFFEEVLNNDSKNAQAYLGKMMAQLQVCRQESLGDQDQPFDDNSNYRKAIRFADDALKTKLTGYLTQIHTRKKNARMAGTYRQAKGAMASAEREKDYLEAAKMFDSIRDYQDSRTLAEKCREKAEQARKDAILTRARSATKSNLLQDYTEAIALLRQIPGWKDADALVLDYQNKLRELETKNETARLAAAKRAKRNKRIALVAAPIVCAIVLLLLVLNPNVGNSWKYKKAVALMDTEQYAEAVTAFEALAGYEDSAEKITECNYLQAAALMDAGKYAEAVTAFEALGAYKDSAEKITQCNYLIAAALMDTGRYQEAAEAFAALDGYADSTEKTLECYYQRAEQIAQTEDYAVAALAYAKAAGYKDAKEKSMSMWRKVDFHQTISAGTSYALAVKNDGTVVDTDISWYDVSGWRDIVSVGATSTLAVGLKPDGTVVATGTHRGDFSYWRDIIAVMVDLSHTVGLKADGTVIAWGDNSSGRCNVSTWRDIVAIATSHYYTVGLKYDGTVLMAGVDRNGVINVFDWENIVAICAGDYHVVGLTADGKVKARGNIYNGALNVDDWEDIVAISASGTYTVGLKSDGTVIVAGVSEKGPIDVSGWRDIVTVCAGDSYVIGVQSDGTVLFEGYDYGKLRVVENWKNIKLPQE